MDCSGSRKIRINGLCEDNIIDLSDRSGPMKNIQDGLSDADVYDPWTFIIICLIVMLILCIVAIVIFLVLNNRRGNFTFVHAGYQPVVILV